MPKLDINIYKPTKCEPNGGKPPGFGTAPPSSGLFTGEGARAPFGCPHE